MNPQILFSIATWLALTGWLALALFPRFRWITHVVVPMGLCLVLCVAYAGIMAMQLPGADGGFGSLVEVGTLFGNRWILLAGWLHYLAFDLFIGAWIVRDAQAVRLHHLLVVPCLVLALFAGPVGLLLYAVLRSARTRRPDLETT